MRWTKPDDSVSGLIEESRLQHEREMADRQAERVAALAAAEEQRKQVADATFAMEGAINAAVEKWYTSAGWQGNKVGPRPRTARPPPPANVVLGTLLATLHEVPNLEDTDPIAVASESPSDVKKAYMRAARAIHPDKLTGAPLAKALTAQRVFATITAAYEALKEAQGTAL